MPLLRALVLLVAVLAAAGRITAAPSATPSAPYTSGTVWTYRVLKTDPAGNRALETRTVTYSGVATYRGQPYHVFETRSSLAGPQGRSMTIWTGTVFRTAVSILTQGGNTVEIVFDRPYATVGVSEALAGRTEIYRNGEPAGRGGWSNVVSRGKTVKVTVPAGTFTATRYEGALIVGNVKQVYTMYAVGAVEVRADVETFDRGVRQSSSISELTRGPVGK
ncbi:MAG TPA: hypothetical protein VNN19_12180 [bacterium]|nr:hypothetical protein [bacterium]